jgi:hypothetical protein
MWLLFGLLLGMRGGLDVGPHGCLDRLLVGLIFGLPILWGVGLLVEIVAEKWPYNRTDRRAELRAA